MAVVLWWGSDGSLLSNYGSCFVVRIDSQTTAVSPPQNNSHHSIITLLSYPHHKTTAVIR
jgi:hypothetical protein